MSEIANAVIEAMDSERNKKRKATGLSMPSASLVDKFRGCLMGVLCGDCVGGVFEFARSVGIDDVTALMNRVSRKSTQEGSFSLRYTDDTAMTISLARSLIETRLDQADLLTRFASSYSAEPHRGYGGGVIGMFADVNAELRKGAGLSDPTRFAREQFSGSGSYGNGSAMRVAPVALFHHNDCDKAIQAAESQSLVTHTHADAVFGAVLQATAVWLAVNSEPHVDPLPFLDKLMLATQPAAIRIFGDTGNRYEGKMATVRRFLSGSEEPRKRDVVEQLGHDVSAAEAVPTAIYCFLSSCSGPRNLALSQEEKGLRGTVEYAISLGGDTDTIAAMAGAIAGAYYGTAHLPAPWFDHLEFRKEEVPDAHEMMELAEELHSVCDK